MKRWYALLYLPLVFLTTARPCQAQRPAFTFEVIGTKDGLPGSTVLSATRDRIGFMWFGTRQDVVRYDGANFRRYAEPETNLVTGIAADSSNNIWLSSDRSGICRIDGATLHMEGLPLTPEADLETTGFFYIDRYGLGWYSDRTGVANINLKTRQRKHFTFKPTTYVWTKATFTEDKAGNLWVIGRDNGLFKYDRAQQTLQCMFGADCPGVARDETMLLSSACPAEDGTLWIGSFNAGLLHYNPATNTLERYATERRTNQINTVTPGVDENGKTILWVGDTEGVGIYRPDQHRFFFFDNILPDPYEVNHIYRDPVNGIVWICTSDGIIKYNPASNVIRNMPLPHGMVANPVNINTVLHDQLDPSICYLGLSHSGIVRWNKTTNDMHLIPYPPGTSPETKWMAQRPNGTLWIGTNRWDYQRPGIFVYDPQHKKYINTPLARLANKFYSVPFFMYGGFDHKNRLWIGNSDEGIHVLEEETTADVTPWPAAAQKQLLRNNNLINDLYIDPRGNTWLGTMQGVFKADEAGAQFVKADPADVRKAPQDPAVNSLLADRHGNLWAARWGSVTKMDEPGSLPLILTGADGFVDRQNQGLAEDHLGNLWVGNYEGLYCYITATGTLKRFTINDGLVSNNTMGRVFCNPSGNELYIGHQNGISIVNVDQLLKPIANATLGISSFKVHEKEKPVDLTGTITLTPEENAFSVDFIALNYRKLLDNEYAYYLEGFDNDWNYSGSNHRAYYTNLSPGQYTLRMKAGDALGNWSPEMASIHLEVLPAYYETLWFKLLIVTAIAALLYALYRYRINQLLRLQQVRNRISADLHDELGSSLSGISIMGTLARKDLPHEHPALSFIDRMMEEIHQISSSLDDIVWNISPRNDALASIIARMTRYASELFEARQIQYHFHMPGQLGQIKLSMEQRRNFYLIFKESVNNLIKYSKCAQASVRVSIDHKKIFMTIEDDGIGFDTSRTTDRNGLQNLKARATSLKGTLHILSQPGKGTRLELNFPIES